MRRNSKGRPPSSGDEYMIDDVMSDDEDLIMGDEEDEEDDDDDEILSVASSVPTTEASATDARSSASARAQKAEAQRIFSAKLMVIGIFVIVTVAVSISIYGFANQQANESFDNEVESYSSQLFEVSTLRIEDLLQQLGSLGVSFSALALDSGSKWPFVTISSFQAQAMHFFEQQPSSTKNLHLSVLVSQAERAQWEAYSVEASPMWLAESYMQMGMRLPVAGTVVGLLPQVTPYIYQIEPENGTKVEAPTGDGIGYYAPNWMLSVTQPAARQLVNYNTLNDTTYMEIDSYLSEASENQSAPVVSTGPMDVFDEILLAGDEDDQLEEPPASPETTWPQSIIATALFDSFDEESRTRVATLSSQVFWHALFEGILSDESLKGPLILALEDSCGRSFMYEITESGVVYKGSASKPDLPSGQIVFSNTYEDLPLTVCNLTLHVSPSVEFSEASSTNQPAIYTVAVLGIFGIMGFFFCLYDRLTGKSYSEAISKVERSKSIVEAFFPQNVRDRLLNDKSTRSEAASKSGNSSRADDDDDLDDFLQKSRHGLNGKPIADLHPSVTVLFADIASFTAWASVREPSQVFLLLETLYHSFDKLCRRYKIFKVETIGDCYVAVSGLPEFCDEHAVNMARFAQEIMVQMHKIVKQLEITLGPETAELALRIGIHSGPVTAGVLRGEKSRFQLFGDTVNTASRMESTGARNRIQVSSDTAAQLEKWGKPSWLVPRDDLVPVKGKGDMKTYWLYVDDCNYSGSEQFTVSTPQTPAESKRKARRSVVMGKNQVTDLDLSQRSASGNSESGSAASPSVASPEEKKERLVNWSADLLLGLLKRIVAMRESEETLNELKEFQSIVKGLDDRGSLSTRASFNIDGMSKGVIREPTIKIESGKTVLDEVAEIISLPRKAARYQQDPANVELGEAVVKQLYRFVREIARMYRDNPFHNFDHASHVTQSLTKLLSRVVAPDEVDYENMKYKKKAATKKLHQFTFGLTSDPICQFACAFSSLIHDLDHPGVPNAVLVSEETAIAKHYKNKSVAEQNSVDLAWSLLMEPRFKDLRQCIYRTQTELDRFRQLVVNSVMATDIVDKELGALRKKRWERAFNKNPDDELDEKATDEVNRKATIVIEHLIQAADVAHTMQHWHVYLKWNERFFHECYAVYLSGRSQTDPSEGWYKGEIGFFDFYIIPLAKKLENCGVFGVSSDECLSYATQNRQEWERRGQEIVKGYLARYGK